MNTIFKCNVNAKYSTKDLKGCYNSNNFSLLNIYLDEYIPRIALSHKYTWYFLATSQPSKLAFTQRL